MLNQEIQLGYQWMGKHGRTKTEILRARLAELKAVVADIEGQLEWAENKECSAHPCDCGHVFTTEQDFNDHFIVSDERWLNLGNCPILDRSKS